ncbi:(2Fe-2S)-binding protein [Pseudoclavibacter helvolus]
MCRCEEVTAGQLRRKASATRSRSLRSQKLSTRAGLGICQARICGRSAEELLRAATGAARELDEGIVDRRPIQTPIRLAELAGISEEQHPSTGRQDP